jgi:hypothetical protein
MVQYIQHIELGIPTLAADCRPPTLVDEGSVNPQVVFTHPALVRVYMAYHGAAVLIKRLPVKGSLFMCLFCRNKIKKSS